MKKLLTVLTSIALIGTSGGTIIQHTKSQSVSEQNNIINFESENENCLDKQEVLNFSQTKANIKSILLLMERASYQESTYAARQLLVEARNIAEKTQKIVIIEGQQSGEISKSEEIFKFNKVAINHIERAIDNTINLPTQEALLYMRINIGDARIQLEKSLKLIG